MIPVAYTYGGPVLKVSGVSLALGGNPILRGVEIDVLDVRVPDRTAGQVVALLGPSGIGKTQLFRIIAGLQAPDAGSVLVGDKSKPVERGMVGVVAQHYPLFAHRKVLGNLMVAGKLGGLSSDQATTRATSLLDRFKLSDAADKYPAQLSGGMRQRVAIAQQFMCSENLLLLDEPFSGLDPIQIDAAVDLILEVASLDELNTIIVVTHDISAAMQVANMICLLGRDHDASGNVTPGARVQATYNLLDLGIAWRKGISEEPEFVALRKEIRGRFATL